MEASFRTFSTQPDERQNCAERRVIPLRSFVVKDVEATLKASEQGTRTQDDFTPLGRAEARNRCNHFDLKKRGVVAVVLARYTPSGRPNEIRYIVEVMPTKP